MTPFEHDECLREALQELQEDAALLRLTLLGAQAPADALTLSCLLRLSNYLDQHVGDIRVLCGK